MSYHLAPIANQQQIDANGDPLSGGKIYTYIAGTSTPATTYTDDTGSTAQTNPIVLNSRGVAANPVWVQGGRTYKMVITDANDVQLAMFDDVPGINDTTVTADQWVVYANAPTYLSATSFSVAGDQTPTFQPGRRLKTVNTGGTVYSTILNAAFSIGITTVTVANDAGALDSGLSSVSYGLISATSNSLPKTAITSGTLTATTSGTAIDFTSIPSWVKRITMQLVGVSTNGTSNLIVQLGDSGGVEASGYLGAAANIASGATSATAFTTGFGLMSAIAAVDVFHGALTLKLHDASTNTWIATGSLAFSNLAGMATSAGSKSLSATLDRVRLTTVGGTAAFDAGSVNITYE